MSKLWKGVKKVFKKVVKFVKKYWVYIAIAVAVYFTAGMALAAMPSTATFSAAMPGFGVGGMFSNAAVAMGATGAAGSGIAGTVAANAAATAMMGGATIAGPGAAAFGVESGTVLTTAAGAQTTAGAAVAAGEAAAAQAAITGAGVTVSAAPTVAQAAAATAKSTAAANAAAAATTSVNAGTTAATTAGMSGLEKVAIAGMVFKGAGGLLSDDQNKINRKQHERENAQSYGIGRDGEGPGMTGLVSDAFAGRFGGEGEEQGASGDSPFTPAQVPQTEGADPFTNMEHSEQQATRDSSYINQGYRNKDYRPG